MNHSSLRTFPYVFDDYIFTPIFIKNLLIEATSTSNKVKLTPQEIYLGKREFETNTTFVKALRNEIQERRKHIFESRLFLILPSFIISQIKGTLFFNDLLKLEWFRFMHLEVLRREIAKLDDVFKQLNISSNAIEAQHLIKEVKILLRKANAGNAAIEHFMNCPLNSDLGSDTNHLGFGLNPNLLLVSHNIRRKSTN